MKSFSRKKGALLAALTAVSAIVAITASTGASVAAAHGRASMAKASVLGAPHKATGKPYVFGAINLELGPVTFPEMRPAENAAADYVNNYLGGINGHPIKIDWCLSDGTAPTSARCASELVAKHPLAILGAIDSGTPGSMPVYKRAHLAYIGGFPLTPVEQTASNSVQFWSLTLGDNVAASVYAAKTLHAKSASVIYVDNSQGQVSGLDIIPPVMKAAGITKVTPVGVPPTSADPTPEAAQAIAGNPGVIYLNLPGGCPAMVQAIRSLGYTGHLVAIDPCVEGPAIAAAGGAANGMFVATAFVNVFGNSSQAKILRAALKKYTAAGVAPPDETTASGFGTVFNTWQTLEKIKKPLTTAKILRAFKTGSNHPNFLSHPYTCNGKAIAKAASICDSHFLMEEVVNGKLTEPSTTAWVGPNPYFKGL